MNTSLEQEMCLLNYYRFKLSYASDVQSKAKQDFKQAKAKFEEQEKVVKELRKNPEV